MSARLLAPQQRAPFVIVRTNDPIALARATPEIARQLDPRLAVPDDRLGWRYEGFYLEARDALGKPFMIVYNFYRSRHSGGGGEWAASENLYPFPHR